MCIEDRLCEISSYGWYLSIKLHNIAFEQT